MRSAILWVTAACAAGGCSGGSRLLEPLAASSGPRLAASDFRSPDAQPALPPIAPDAVRPAGTALDARATPTRIGLPANPTAAVVPDPVITAHHADPLTVEAVPGPPEISGAAPPPVEGASLLDAKVGDINGRAIYASEFLAPMAARLRATSFEKTRSQWINDTRTEITEALRRLIVDELMRAEALETIPAANREVGLSRFLAANRAGLQSQAGGSLTEAQRRLMEEQGLTIEQWLRRGQDYQLVRLTEQIIERGVQISGRDIRNFYERNHEAFNPLPTAVFRRITVRTADADAVAAVRDALERGEAFAQVAARPPNTFSRADGGIITFEFEDPFEQATFFNIDALNDAARSLTQGRWVGPIAYGAGGVLSDWIMLEGVARASRPLYEAQLEISEVLRRREVQARRTQFINRLRDRASFTSEPEMVQRLLEIAAARYYPPGQSEPRPGAAPPPRPRP